jgi:hypothetical protein
MKTLKQWISALALTFLCGCFQVEDELNLQADGSGTVKMTVRSSLAEELLGMIESSSPFGGHEGQMYPPTSDSQARRFFPPKNFTVKVDQKDADTIKTLIIEAGFKDVNALLASPYGRAHQLVLKIEANGTLKLQALGGGSTLARAAQIKGEDDVNLQNMPGLEDARKKKDEMRFMFRVTLPNTVIAANGARESQAVTWSVERAKCKDDEEFASKLSGVLEASCSAEALKFSPAGPPRLGLLPFSQLVEGKAASGSGLPDTNKVMAAARFVPYVLHVTRSLDLSGEDFGQGSEAQLTGALILPPELIPQRWGKAKLEEAIDAKGNSLMPKEDDAQAMLRRYQSMEYGLGGESDEEDPNEATPGKTTGQKPHLITLSFKAPEWKIKQIAKVRGVLELKYLGGAEIIKLSNAVPAALVVDMSKTTSFQSGFDSERGQVTNPRLGELGLSLRVAMAMVQGSMTTLSIETTGANAALVDAQVFDVDGQPWPTTLMQNDSAADEDRSSQIIVTGAPKPPFSLALQVGGVGASIAVPILVENVPVGDK